MKELEFKPVAAFRMDDNTPFTDYSGYSAVGALNNTEVRGIPLTSTATYSQVLSSSNLAFFTVPGFVQQGNEDQSYSVSMTVYPKDSFGFTYDDGLVGFGRYSNNWQISAGYEGEESVTSDYYIDDVVEKYNIVATYSRESMSLFLNGVMVINHQIPDEFQSRKWLATSNLWAITGDVLVSNVCFYNTALSNEQINSIHQYNNRHVIEDVPVAFGGQTIRVSREVRTPSMEVVWDSKAEWDSGTHYQTTVVDNQLSAQKSGGLTVDGLWQNSITFVSPVPLSTFDSAYLTWNGKHANIEVSLDDVTWVTPVNGEPLSIISTGFDPNDKTLLVRVSFIATWDEAYLDNLTFRAFTGPDAPNHIDDRIITYANPVAALDEYKPNQMNDFWGARILAPGRVTIGANPENQPMTIEFICRLDSPLYANTSANTGSVGYYVNGILAGAIPSNEWFIIHYVFDTPVTGDIWIEGNLRLGRVALYPTKLTLDEVARVVQSYTGFPKSQVSDGAVIQVSEPSTPAAFYAHTWANLFAPS